MRIAAYDNLVPNAPLQQLPVSIDQSSARIPAALVLMVLALPLTVMAAPFAMIVAAAADEPSLRALLKEHPVATLQATLGLVVWLALFAWPAQRLAAKAFTSRHVTISDGYVTVTEQNGLFGDETWSEPLSSFDGVAHHIRTSMSGTRHELFLAHPDRDRSVQIAVADRITKQEVERAAALFCLPEVPAHFLYRRTQRALSPGPNAVPLGSARA